LLHLGGAAGQFLRFQFPRALPLLGLIVGAEKDEVVPAADIQKLVARLSLQKGITSNRIRQAPTISFTTRSTSSRSMSTTMSRNA